MEKSTFVCGECAGETLKWQGQCPHCQTWNTLVEQKVAAPESKRRYKGLAVANRVQRLADVEVQQVARLSSGLSELDRVLGGGFVLGAVVLLGGDPGIGKSTLLLQVLCKLADQYRTLYVSGEESAQQIALRATRLAAPSRAVQMLAEIQLETILVALEQVQPQLAIIDSIQTVYSETLGSAPGSVAQVRECAAQLTRFAKRCGVTLVLVGHVTKEGALAGPRVLEHIVDTVLYFEGDTHSNFRLIRAFKNRFGAVNELGVFAMTENGLKGVTNPSALFLAGHAEPVAGAAVVVTQEGTRALLVEVQALVDESHSPNPRRLANGLEQNRLALLLAVLHRHTGIALFDQDVFINAVGGIRITEPAADLAILAAVISSYRSRPLRDKLVVFGEVGLAGEIRPVPGGQQRLKEAATLGFKYAIVPAANAPKPAEGQRVPFGVTVFALQRIDTLLDYLFE